MTTIATRTIAPVHYTVPRSIKMTAFRRMKIDRKWMANKLSYLESKAKSSLTKIIKNGNALNTVKRAAKILALVFFILVLIIIGLAIAV